MFLYDPLLQTDKGDYDRVYRKTQWKIFYWTFMNFQRKSKNFKTSNRITVRKLIKKYFIKDLLNFQRVHRDKYYNFRTKLNIRSIIRESLWKLTTWVFPSFFSIWKQKNNLMKSPPHPQNINKNFRTLSNLQPPKEVRRGHNTAALQTTSRRRCFYC